jgi:hypothetical protein
MPTPMPIDCMCRRSKAFCVHLGHDMCSCACRKDLLLRHHLRLRLSSLLPRDHHLSCGHHWHDHIHSVHVVSTVGYSDRLTQRRTLMDSKKNSGRLRRQWHASMMQCVVISMLPRLRSRGPRRNHFNAPHSSTWFSY